MNTKHDPISLIDTPHGYVDWLTDLKTRIHSAPQRAALSVNHELVLLYWQIGRDIRSGVSKCLYLCMPLREHQSFAI